MITPTTAPESVAPDLGLNSLELLGAYLTSQIHGLNNQMAVLSNSEWLQPAEASASTEMTEYLAGLFAAVKRLSVTCNHFNVARKRYPVLVGKLPVPEGVAKILEVTARCPGWTATDKTEGAGLVTIELDWLYAIFSQLTERMETAGGTIELSIGELPPRQYKHSLRVPFNYDATRALLVQFRGNDTPAPARVEPPAPDFPIAMELIRLMGAGVSLTRMDAEKDYLIAFQLHA